MLVTMKRNENSRGATGKNEVGIAITENDKWRFLKNLIKELHVSAIPLLGTCPKEIQKMSKGYLHSKRCTAAFSIIVKMQKQPKCLSVHEWIEMFYMYGIVSPKRKSYSCYL